MLRQLTEQELSLVAGTGWWQNGYYYTAADLDGDGYDDVIEQWSGDPSGDGLFMDSDRIDGSYLSAGWALGIGFGVEYTSVGGLDVNWLGGVGAYAQVGVASDGATAIDNVIGGEDDIIHPGESGITTDGDNVSATGIIGLIVVDDDRDPRLFDYPQP